MRQGQRKSVLSAASAFNSNIPKFKVPNYIIMLYYTKLKKKQSKVVLTQDLKP